MISLLEQVKELLTIAVDPRQESRFICDFWEDLAPILRAFVEMAAVLDRIEQARNYVNAAEMQDWARALLDRINTRSRS